MTRWPRENTFDDLVHAAATAHGLDSDLVKGLIAHESGFDPNAVGDDGRSIGLMQVQTIAAADAGFQLTETQLKDPGTNIGVGTTYLAMQIGRAGSIDAGISAYNGGYRPSLGFGRPLPSGSFRNQAYVDSVKQNWAYFRAQRPTVAPTTEADAPAPKTVLLIGALAVLVSVVAWLVLR